MEDYSFDGCWAVNATSDVGEYGLTVEEAEHPANGIIPISGDMLAKLGAK